MKMVYYISRCSNTSDVSVESRKYSKNLSLFGIKKDNSIPIERVVTVKGSYFIHNSMPSEYGSSCSVREFRRYDDVLKYIGPKIDELRPLRPQVYLTALDTQHSFIYVDSIVCTSYTGWWSSAPSQFINTIYSVLEVCRCIDVQCMSINVEDDYVARFFNTMSDLYSSVSNVYKDVIARFNELKRGRDIVVVSSFRSYFHLVAELEAVKGVDYSYSLQEYYEHIS